MKNSIASIYLIMIALYALALLVICAEFSLAGGRNLPDIASPYGIEIGGVRGEWGGVIRINADNAYRTDDGRCVFDYGLELINAGGAPAGNFDYRLNADGWSAVSAQSALEAGEWTNSSGRIALSPGKHKVVVKLDNNDNLDESDEMNNAPLALRVEIDGECESRVEDQPILADKDNNY